MSTNSDVTVPKLCTNLGHLVAWQPFALNLSGIDMTIIRTIENNFPNNLARQKIALYDEWLKSYPQASWADVIRALEAAGEITIANKLRERYQESTGSLLPESNRAYFQSTPVTNEQTPREQVDVPERIVNQLETHKDSFVSLTRSVRDEVQNTEANGHLDDVVFHIQEEARAFPIPSLESVTTTAGLFNTIRHHYNFLNCHLVVTIALFLSGTIAQRATEYSEHIDQFMKAMEIKYLQRALKRCRSAFRATPSDSKIVEIVVENVWAEQKLWLIEVLVKTLFPVRHPDELPWYEIVGGSVIMRFIALDHMTASLIESSKKKTEFMRFVGIISLKIGDELVWAKTNIQAASAFSFEDSLIRCTAANDIETVEFLLKYTHLNVDTQNSLNTLINIDETRDMMYVTEKEVASFMKSYHATFELLLEDVKYELQQKTAAGLDDPGVNDSTTGPSSLGTRPLDNFMNARVLAGLCDQLSDRLSTRVKNYKSSVDGIVKRHSLLTYIGEPLKDHFPVPFTDSIEVTMVLHSAWKASCVWYVEWLGQLMLSLELFYELQWFRVDASPSSAVAVTFLTDKNLAKCIKESITSNETLLTLFGVISVEIDGLVVIRNDYSSRYSFLEAIGSAKAKGAPPVVSDLLLLIHQLPVEFHEMTRATDGNNNRLFLPDPDSTPLMIATCNDNSQLVQLLLDHNANPNIQNRRGVTALIYSCGNHTIFRKLLHYGADITITTSFSETTMHFACDSGNIKVVNEILAIYHNLASAPDNSGDTPLMVASHRGHILVIERLLIARIDPNIQNNEGRTALMVACRHGRIAAVKCLLQLGKAEMNIRDNDGWTALAMATNRGHIEIVELLLLGGADGNIRNNDGRTALDLAISNGNDKLVQILLQTV